MDLALKRAVLSVLHPLVRYLIGRGWTYPVISALLKEVYVAEAVSLDAAEESITDSRVSLLTGIHRKEVNRLRQTADGPADQPVLRHDASIAVRIVAEWVTSRKYLNSQGKPRPLPLRAVPNKPSFETLVSKVKADMRPAVVLDELLRAGVAKLEKDKVHLLRNAYVSALPEDKLAFLGANVGDHLRSALRNIDHPEAPLLERAVYYGLVDTEALNRLRPELHQRAERFLREINGLVMPLNDAAIKKSVVQGRRMRLGVYYYEDDTATSDTALDKKKEKQ